jgi:hypothetical protein
VLGDGRFHVSQVAYRGLMNKLFLFRVPAEG